MSPPRRIEGAGDFSSGISKLPLSSAFMPDRQAAFANYRAPEVLKIREFQDVAAM